ncbi:MAG: WxcM-like domain-containing protein [Muribaculaceae bacterium]|nr:WxcM-like domain-containing protein [Muribaculaceae bacterium]
MSPLDKVRYLDFPKICDPRGNLTFIEGGRHVPFPIKRVFYIYDVPGGAWRGAHAHKQCTQVLIPVAGSFDARLSDGSETRQFHLAGSDTALMVPPGLWLSTHNYTTGSICLVLCDELYDEDDYIRDFDDYLEYAKNTFSIPS